MTTAQFHDLRDKIKTHPKTIAWMTKQGLYSLAESQRGYIEMVEASDLIVIQQWVESKPVVRIVLRGDVVTTIKA